MATKAKSPGKTRKPAAARSGVTAKGSTDKLVRANKNLWEVDVEGNFGCFACLTIKTPDDVDVQEVVDQVVELYDGFEFELSCPPKVLAAYGRANALQVTDADCVRVNAEDVDLAVSRGQNGELIFDHVGKCFPSWPLASVRAANSVRAATLPRSSRTKATCVFASGGFPCFATWVIEVPEHTREADANTIIDLIDRKLGHFNFDAKSGTHLTANESVEDLCVKSLTVITTGNRKPDFVVTRNWSREWVLAEVRTPFVLRSSRPRPKQQAGAAAATVVTGD